MGYELNKKERKKLIYLYEEYIKNPKDEFIRKNSWDLISTDDFFFTPAVEMAGNATVNIFNGNLPLNKAKKILKELKKEDEEDK